MPDITLKATVDYETTQPYKVELTRSQKGTYGWTVTVHGIQADIAIDDLEHIDEQLREKYIPLTPAPEEA